MLIGVVMSRPKKSASENWTLRLAPRHRSIASSTVDLPLSPGPIRQLMPGVGHQVSHWMPRKLAISIFLIRAMGFLSGDVRPWPIHEVFAPKCLAK